MNIQKNKLPKSQIEFTVELSQDEFKPYIEKGAQEISKEMKIDGFRPGKASFEAVKTKVGEMTILEQAAHFAINKTLEKILDKEMGEDDPVGRPEVSVTKMAPGNPLEFKIKIAIIPEITLGEYKELNVKPVEVKIDEKEIEQTIDYLKESRAKEAVVNREIKTGDKVIANVEMFLDKVPLEGGKANDTTLMIGKEYFVAGFDAKMIGAKKGDVREFTLPYPKDFHQKNIAGKTVEFRVTVKNVLERSMPELNDEFATAFGAKTMEELKGTIRTDIEKHKSFEAEKKTEMNILEKVLEKTTFGEIPEILINNESEKMLVELEENVARQGGKMEDYLTSIKKTKEQLVLDLLPEAMKRIKTAMLIKKIAEVEKIKVSEKEVEEKQNELLKQYAGYAKVEERVKDPSYKIYLHNSLTNQKTIDKLKEWNIVSIKN